MPPDELWLPKATTKATVRDGQVTVWDEMQFERVKVGRPAPGFQPPPSAEREPEQPVMPE